MSSKKSETLEVRLSHRLKTAFMERCRAADTSASETIRDLIESYLERRPEGNPRRWVRALIAVIAAASVGAIAAPTLARPSPQAVFKTMDRRHMGLLSFDDFNAAASVRADVSLKRPSPSALFAPQPALQQQNDLVTAEERRAIVHRVFDSIDANHDGEITLDEFRRYYGT